MKVFVCSDLHGIRTTLYRIDSHLASHTYDCVFMLGDLCNMHDPNALTFAKQFIELIKERHKLPLFVVHGNQEPESVRLLYQYEEVTVHFNPKQFHGFTIVGVGYGDTFPIDPKFAAGKVLLTHEPPRASTIAMMKKKGELPHAPYVHFSGHLHKLAKVHEFANTTLVQVPAAQDNRAVKAELLPLEIHFLYLK